MDSKEYTEYNDFIDLKDKLIDSQKEIDKEIQSILDEYFWDLI